MIKLQQGGLLPALTYSPTKFTQLNPDIFTNKYKEEARPVLDLEDLYESEGYYNDKLALVERANKAYKELNTLPIEKIHSIQGQKLVNDMQITPAELARLKASEDMGKTALKAVTDNKGLNTYVRNNQQELYVKYKDKIITISDIQLIQELKKGTDLEILSAADLSRERKENPYLINRNDVFSDISKTVGYNQVIDKVQKYITKVGSNESERLKAVIPNNPTLIWKEKISTNYKQVRDAVEGVYHNLDKSEYNVLRNEALNDILEGRQLFTDKDIKDLDLDKAEDLDKLIELQMRNKITASFKRVKSYKSTKGKPFTLSSLSSGTTKDDKYNIMQEFISGTVDKKPLYYQLGNSEQRITSPSIPISSVTQESVSQIAINSLPIVNTTNIDEAQSSIGIPIDLNTVVIPKGESISNMEIPYVNGKVALDKMNLVREYLGEVDEAMNKYSKNTPANARLRDKAINTILSKPKYKSLRNGIDTRQVLSTNVVFNEEVMYDKGLNDDEIKKFSEEITDKNYMESIASDFKKQEIDVTNVTDIGAHTIMDNYYKARIFIPFSQSAALLANEKDFTKERAEGLTNEVQLNKHYNIKDISKLNVVFAPELSEYRNK